MQVEYRSDVKSRYMVIDPGGDDTDKDDYRLVMITKNRIDGFAKCFSEEMDGRKLLYYDVTGLLKLSDYLEAKKADSSFYKSLFLNLATVLESSQEYLLDPDGIMLCLDSVFADISDGVFRFIYCPYSSTDFFGGCKALSEGLLKSIRQDDIDAVRLGYGFYKNCASGRINAQLLRDMAAGAPVGRSVIDAVEEASLKEKDSEGEGQADSGEDHSFLFQNAEKKKKRLSGGFLKRFIPAGKPQKQEQIGLSERTAGKGHKNTHRDLQNVSESHAEYSTKNMIKNDTKNRIKSDLQRDAEKEPQIRGWLLSEKNFPDDGIILTKDRYLIGRKNAGADISLNSTAISRAHARISWHDGAYHVVDLSSRNGTQVNGSRLSEGMPALLRDGDEICFADSMCVYRQLTA